MPSNVKRNKRAGHQAEGEIGKRTATWPWPFTMVRTGLDGGHDLRGPDMVGEVKSVKAGPVWLKDGLAQLSNSAGRPGLLFTKLGAGSGKGSRWLVTVDLEFFERMVTALQSSEESVLHG